MNLGYEFISAIIGAVMGYVFGILSDGLLKKIRLTKRRKIAGFNPIYEKDILPISVPGHKYEKDEIDITVTPDSNIFFSLPAEFAKDAAFAENFVKTDILPPALFSSQGDENEIRQLMEEARTSVAESFANNFGGNYFNGKMYGVKFASSFARQADPSEKPILRLRLYETDYYSHKVLEYIEKRLPAMHSELSITALNEDPCLFRSSLGLSIVVELPGSEEIVMTKRSPYSSYSDGKSRTYISATETVSETDYDTYNATVNLWLAVRRALDEELGIPESLIQSIEIVSMFFETNFRQDNIVAVVTLNEEVNFSAIKEYAICAKDRILETSELFAIHSSKGEIKKYIAQNKDSMRPQTIYSLFCYMCRL